MRILLAWLWPMLRQRWRMLALAVLLALVALALWWLHAVLAMLFGD